MAGSGTLRFTGLIAATHTPLRADGQVALDVVPRQVEQLLADGVAGLYVNGSTGEGASLTSDERRQLAKAFVSAAAGRIPVVVQVGHNSLAEACALSRHAAEIGAAAFSATPPSYFKPASLEALVRTVAEIAGAAPELPFYYYHIPTFTAVQVDVVEFLRVAGPRIPNFAGIKYTAPTLHEYQACLELEGARQGGQRFDALFGTDEMLLSALALGARGAVGSTYNFAAPLYRRMIAAFDAGDLHEARRLQALSVAMVRVIMKYRPLPAIKGMMKLAGIDCGPVRLPLETLSPEEQARLEREMREIGFFELGRK